MFLALATLEVAKDRRGQVTLAYPSSPGQPHACCCAVIKYYRSHECQSGEANYGLILWKACLIVWHFFMLFLLSREKSLYKAPVI